MSVLLYVFSYVCFYMYVWMYLCMHVCINICMYACMYCIYVRTYVQYVRIKSLCSTSYSVVLCLNHTMAVLAQRWRGGKSHRPVRASRGVSRDSEKVSNKRRTGNSRTLQPAHWYSFTARSPGSLWSWTKGFSFKPEIRRIRRVWV